MYISNNWLSGIKDEANLEHHQITRVLSPFEEQDWYLQIVLNSERDLGNLFVAIFTTQEDKTDLLNQLLTGYEILWPTREDPRVAVVWPMVEPIDWDFSRRAA